MAVEYMLNIIKQRRSLRRFSEEKIEKSQLETLIEAAIWAPTGSNAQAWQFVVIDDEVMIRRLTAFLPGVLQPPPAIICLCIDYEREQKRAGKLGVEVLGIMDVSMAAQNIMLVAAAMQLGSCAVRGFNEDVIKKALSLPQFVRPELLVLIGRTPGTPGRVKPPGRRPLKEVLHWQKYKNEGGLSHEQKG